MISTVRVFRPALGKERELRALLTEWVRTRQSDGANSNLLQRVYNSEPPALTITTRYDDLAALEEGRKRTMASDGFGRFQERLSGLLTSHVPVAIYDTVVPARPAGAPGVGAGGIVVRRFFTPVHGKGGLQKLLKETATYQQSLGYRAGLSRRIMQDGEHYFVTTNLHDSLADYGVWLDENRDTEHTRAFFQQLNPLLAKPHVVRFFEVVVPFPAR